MLTNETGPAGDATGSSTAKMNLNEDALAPGFTIGYDQRRSFFDRLSTSAAQNKWVRS